MNITKNISPFIVSCDDTVGFALKKINQNTKRLVFSVKENGVLEGLMTDGDFRRWVVRAENVDLSIPVRQISNKNISTGLEDDNSHTLQSFFNSKVTAVPLLDHLNRITAIIWNEDLRLRIGDFIIGNSMPSFLIAEIGNNHNGSVSQGKKLVEAAAAAGADCAKFQLRDLESLYNKGGNSISEDLGAEYTLDLLKRFQLSTDETFELLDYVRECGMVPLCTPWDMSSLEKLDDYGLESFKIASADLTNHPLLKAAASTGKPILISTGMSTEREILESVKLLNEQCASFSLLQCNSTYPTPFNDINLEYLRRLKEISKMPVGYSGHERGFEVCIAAIALGARIIEKHFTFDRKAEGNDHKVSLLPGEFKSMVKAIRNVEESMGTVSERFLSQGERLNREVLAKSVVASRDISIGQKISESMLEIFSPGRGLQPSRINDLLGRTACRDMLKGDVFFESDILGQSITPRNYSFNRPWGVPVRYFDFSEICSKAPVDFVEIHFSYRDLDLNPSDYFNAPSDVNLVVHSPELFSGDHLMDLSSADDSYRNHSISELQRVINRTRELKKYFPETERPLIIVNAGGFTLDGFLSESKYRNFYDKVGDALSLLDEEGVEIIPQTMPPFPWHFGGQRFHNLFVNAEEIQNFCEKFDRRVCFDTSHSKLACNYHKWSFHEFSSAIGKYVAHLHIVDAKGHHDEGLQIGDGEIDFESLGLLLDEFCPNVSFIPEIWQGHKNGGEGFWIGLDRLEEFFNNK